jgi:hypothetical protein
MDALPFDKKISFLWFAPNNFSNSYFNLFSRSKKQGTS